MSGEIKGWGGRQRRETEEGQREEPPKGCKRTKTLVGCDAKG